MGITREFFETWLKENVGKLPPESEVSPAVLARQFERDADAEGYGPAVREEEIGNVEEAIVAALEEARMREPSSEDARGNEPAPLMEALEPGDPDSGP
jgi:hypothetical protein